MAVVVVLRRAVGKVPSGASKASRSASRVLRITRVSIVRRGCVVGTLGPPIAGRARRWRPAWRRGSPRRRAAGPSVSRAGDCRDRPARPRRSRAGCAGLTGGRPPRSGSSRCSGLNCQPSRDKFGRQPVEQLGMGGRLAQPAEIAGRADQAATEMILPDPVDDDASRQRIVGPGQPSGQSQAAARSIGRAGRAWLDPPPAPGRAPREIPARSAPACGRRRSQVGGDTGPTSVTVEHRLRAGPAAWRRIA